MTDAVADDVEAIRALIARQFASLSWQVGETPDLETFRGDFVENALLFASARPVRAQTVDEFSQRMQGLCGTTLKSFVEAVTGTRIMVFGNVAMAAVACENLENSDTISRNVEMILLVKDDGVWRIAAQAWDGEREGLPVASGLQGAAWDRRG